jgi:hypothetical protein
VVYRQLVRFGSETLEVPDQLFFFPIELWFCVTSSLTRGSVCGFQFLLALTSAVILGTHDPILLSQIRDFPNLEGQVPVFIYPRNRVAQLYPQGPGFHFHRLL